MSVEAMSYALNLTQCRDGAPLSQLQKFVLVALADFHNIYHRTAWPSIDLLAEICLCDRRTVQRVLAYLETHMTIARVYPKQNGRGRHVKYVFTELENTVAPATERRHRATNSSTRQKKVPKRRQKCVETTTEGRLPATPNKEEPEPYLEPEPGEQASAQKTACSSPPKKIYCQADYDERDYRKLCAAREAVHAELAHKAQASVGTGWQYPSMCDINREAAKRCGILPEKLARLLVMEAANDDRDPGAGEGAAFH